MEQIIRANRTIMSILGKAKQSVSGYRLLHYCVPVQVEEGTLLFNVLTRELLLLTPEEYANALDCAYLRQQWFVVPMETDEKKLVGLVRWLQGTMRKESKHIDKYTIMTTMDCNARCFYCYELGRARIPMSNETAVKTADFIKANCGGKEVNISWFGGEPLYNAPVIDVITDRLREGNVAFRCSMVSNAYLFDDALVQKAKENWNLKWVQITLDGTEQVYNRCKAFIYREGSAYQVVIGNIARLLEAGISVVVRMNIDFHNADDLMALAEELAERFKGKTGLRAYPHLIFDEKKSWDERYPLDQWKKLYQMMNRLEDKLVELGLHTMGEPLKRELRRNYCMADDEHAVVVTPDGHLSVCEHFSESEFIGDLDSQHRDKAVITSWCEHCDEIPECNDCFYYPDCVRIKKCPDLMPCIEPDREKRRRRLEAAMMYEFRRWQNDPAADTLNANDN